MGPDQSGKDKLSVHWGILIHRPNLAQSICGKAGGFMGPLEAQQEDHSTDLRDMWEQGHALLADISSSEKPFLACYLAAFEDYK